MNVTPPPFRLTARFACLGALLMLLAGCTRFEDSVTLAGDAKQQWTLTWHTLARRGINLVDSSGNVGSASVRFSCVAHAQLPLTWLVDGAATRWKGSGPAARRLSEEASRIWRGTVTLQKTATGHALVIDLHDERGRPFVGNRRYEKAQGNGQSWHAQ